VRGIRDHVHVDAAVLAVDLQIKLAVHAIASATDCPQRPALELDHHRIDQIQRQPVTAHQRVDAPHPQLCNEKHQASRVRDLQVAHATARQMRLAIYRARSMHRVGI
jgi:hypothetical protein